MCGKRPSESAAKAESPRLATLDGRVEVVELAQVVKPEQPRNVNPLMLVTLVGMVEAVRRNYARMHTHRSSQPSAETSHLHLPSCLDSQPRRDLIWSGSDCSRSFLNSQFNHEVALAHGLARRQVPQRRRDGSEASHRLVRLGPHTLPADSERQSPSKTAVQRLALARGIALYLYQPPDPLRQLHFLAPTAGCSALEPECLDLGALRPILDGHHPLRPLRPLRPQALSEPTLTVRP